MAAWDEGWAWEEAVRSSPELWLFRVWLCQERQFPASPDVPGTGDQGGGEKTEKENRSGAKRGQLRQRLTLLHAVQGLQDTVKAAPNPGRG